jgi:hypothetical protein
VITADIENILAIWHEHFKDANNQYSEFEDSDIEYFVGCMLYNHFSFEYALDTMKTIDLSYDFLTNCGDEEYKKVLGIIDSIKLEDEEQKIDYLQNYLEFAMKRYSGDELYLIGRLKYHVDSLQERFQTQQKAQKVVFEKPKPKSANPLLR